MYVDMDQFRRAIVAAPIADLSKIASTIWGCFGEEGFSEEQVDQLLKLIESRKVVGTPQPRRSHSGSRPRTSESMVRRRQQASTGEIPAAIAGRFTQAERAVLQVIGTEVGRGGDCRLCHEKVAALAGVSKTTVKRAIREARALGLITVEQRKIGHRRNDPSIIRIISPEWLAGMRLSPSGRAIAARGIIVAATQGHFAPPTSDSKIYGETFGLWKRDASGRMQRDAVRHIPF